MGLPIEVGTYPIDTAHTQLGFSIVHLGISTISGTFDEFRGELTVGDDLSDTSVTIEAEMASINSSNPLRDERVHAADYLDVANHPRMSFRSTSIAESTSGYALNGDLTIRNVTVPTTFDVTYNGRAIFPIDGTTHFGFTGRATISRSAFGVSQAPDVISDEVDLTLDVQFSRPDATADGSRTVAQ
jgi:polyisoprenoid-binding protein YceI